MCVIDTRRWALLTVLGGFLAACGGQALPDSGVLSGFATPCVGPLTNDHHADVPMQVTITKGRQPVATETVRQAGAYQFVLPQGQYEVSSDHPSVSAAGYAFTVFVHAGEVTNLSLSAHCK